MNIVTGPDGKQYLEFNGAILGPALASPTADSYTLEGVMEMRGAVWNERTYVTPYLPPLPSYTPPPAPPPQPHGRFLHLDWEGGAV